MGAMSANEDPGKAVFMKLSPGEQHDLKRFITGQIQNILANEYGVGGTKTLKSHLDTSIAQQLNHEKFIESVAARILHSNRIDAKSVINKALETAAKKAIAEIVGEAASNIHVTFQIGAPAPAGLVNENYGQF